MEIFTNSSMKLVSFLVTKMWFLYFKSLLQSYNIWIKFSFAWTHEAFRNTRDTSAFHFTLESLHFFFGMFWLRQSEAFQSIELWTFKHKCGAQNSSNLNVVAFAVQSDTCLFPLLNPSIFSCFSWHLKKSPFNFQMRGKKARSLHLLSALIIYIRAHRSSAIIRPRCRLISILVTFSSCESAFILCPSMFCHWMHPALKETIVWIFSSY